MDGTLIVELAFEILALPFLLDTRREIRARANGRHEPDVPFATVAQISDAPHRRSEGGCIQFDALEVVH